MRGRIRSLALLPVGMLLGAGIMFWLTFGDPSIGRNAPANPPHGSERGAAAAVAPPARRVGEDASAGFDRGEVGDSIAAREALTEKVAQLERGLARSKEALRRSEQQIALLMSLSSYMVKGTGYELPEEGRETSLFAGEIHRESADFSERWAEVPAPDSPDYAAYVQERDALAMDMADLTKALGQMGFPESVKDPLKRAAFQSLQIAGSLGLDPQGENRLNAVLSRAYGTAGHRFDESRKPPGDSTAWEAERTAFARQVYGEVIGTLPDAKRGDFDRLYGRDFFGHINIGVIK